MALFACIIKHTSSAGEIERERNSSKVFEAATKTGAHGELRNEVPLDMSGLTPEFPFIASLWIRSGEWLAIKGK